MSQSELDARSCDGGKGAKKLTIAPDWPRIRLLCSDWLEHAGVTGTSGKFSKKWRLFLRYIFAKNFNSIAPTILLLHLTLSVSPERCGKIHSFVHVNCYFVPCSFPWMAVNQNQFLHSSDCLFLFRTELKNRCFYKHHQASCICAQETTYSCLGTQVSWCLTYSNAPGIRQFQVCPSPPPGVTPGY